MMDFSMASRFITGRAPGSPRTTGSVRVLGSFPKPVPVRVNILDLVSSWTCTSRPMTASYSMPLTQLGGPPSELMLAVVGVRNGQQMAFLKGLADQLETDGQARLGKAAGDRYAGQAG